MVLPVSAELDMLMPDLLFAIEFNGPVHYEPIYGLKKLDAIQAADKRKAIYCRDNGIELCTIDVSQVRRWSVDKLQEFAGIILGLIEDAMERRT